VLRRLDLPDGVPRFPKTVNCAVWGTIELLPCEVLLVDSPLLQRLRGIRQLGMAHLVYPGAGYDRLEHSLGVVEAAQQILSALERNARNRKYYSRAPDRALPEPSDRDRAATRLGALLHDVGHAPFSHATEHLIPVEHAKEFAAANTHLRSVFRDVTSIDPAEQMAVLFALSNSFRKVLEHAHFDTRCPKPQLGNAIAARIMGSREFLDATYLSGVVSGPLDADKIDYMARDSHHAGLPLGLDITRLVSKLEVVEVTTDNAFNQELKKRAEENGGRVYDLGLSRSGLGAFEQLVMARVTLYERLYYHHKIRAAEGMVRNLVHTLGERGSTVTLAELYSGLGDDTLVQVWGGAVQSTAIPPGREATARLAKRLKERELFHRAYSFSSRFLAGLHGLPDTERDETQAILWSSVTGALEDFNGARTVAVAIFEKAKEIAAATPRFRGQTGSLSAADIIVDLPKHSRVAKTTDILVASESGHIGTPNLFFNADKWADAYVHQKQCGYVFAPRDVLQLIALASRIVFYERFGVAMGTGADVAAKTSKLVDDGVYQELVAAKLLSAECLAMLHQEKPRLVMLSAEQVRVPPAFALADPGLAKRIADEFTEALTTGLPGTVMSDVIASIEAMLKALEVIEQGGEFVKSERPDELHGLQPKLRDCLRATGLKVAEGAELGGGETDLILTDTVVLENKVLDATDRPFEQLDAAGWQVRRYAIAISQKVRFVCAAYKPLTEAHIPPLTARVRARAGKGGVDEAVEVQFVVPYGQGIPSKAALRAKAVPGDGHADTSGKT